MRHDYEIVDIKFLPLDGLFSVKIKECNAFGVELAEIEMKAKSLERLVKLIEPFGPINL